MSDNRISDLGPLAAPARLEGLNEARSEAANPISTPDEQDVAAGQPSRGLDQEEQAEVAEIVIRAGGNPLDMSEGSPAAGVVEILRSVDVNVPDMVADMPHV